MAGWIVLAAWVVAYDRSAARTMSSVARAHPTCTAVGLALLAAHFYRPARYARFDPLSRVTRKVS